jgi:hypothetical protein
MAAPPPRVVNKALAALALGSMLLVGCGGQGADPQRVAPDEPTSAAPATTVVPGPGPREVEPEGGLVSVLPTAWQDAKVVDGGRAARLTWYSGVEECYGLDHVDVDYGAQRVTVTLFAGARESKKPCIDLAEQVVTVVRFDEPLGGRKLVDGAGVA